MGGGEGVKPFSISVGIHTFTLPGQWRMPLIGVGEEWEDIWWADHEEGMNGIDG